MLIGRKRASVDVDVRINLDTCYSNAAALQNGTERAGDDTFADSTDDTTRHKDVLHGKAFSQDALSCTILIFSKCKGWCKKLPLRKEKNTVNNRSRFTT